jgi:hypothetical protein
MLHFNASDLFRKYPAASHLGAAIMMLVFRGFFDSVQRILC